MNSYYNLVEHDQYIKSSNQEDVKCSFTQGSYIETVKNFEIVSEKKDAGVYNYRTSKASARIIGYVK